MTPCAAKFYGQTCADIFNDDEYLLAELGVCFRNIADHAFDPSLKDTLLQHRTTTTKVLVNSKTLQMQQIIHSVLVIFDTLNVYDGLGYEKKLKSLLRTKMREALRSYRR
jgi:hypothetical protein